MKMTVDISEVEIEDLMRFTRATTQHDAIVTAIAEYNRRRRIMALVEHAAQGDSMMTPEELQAQRRKG